MSERVVSIVGARPNFVKLATLHDKIVAKGLEHIIVHTGQHYDYELSKVFFEQLQIPEPHVYLGVGSGSQGYQVGNMIIGIEKALADARPSLVVVYGDTNSTLAGALASTKAGYPVAHVEAGLRINDLSMQEEINRRVTDHVSSLLFAPTPTAIMNLKKENVLGKMFLTGDVHVDLLKKYWKIISGNKPKILEKYGLSDKDYMLVTVHRAENTDNIERLRNIVEMLEKLSMISTIVFPIHPRTRKALENSNALKRLEDNNNVKIIEPLGYIDFLSLLSGSLLLVTDSGGAQREAYLLGIKTLLLRKHTEWVELQKAGWVKPVDVSVDEAIKALTELINNRLPSAPNLLGDGRASEKIANIIYNTTREQP